MRIIDGLTHLTPEEVQQMKKKEDIILAGQRTLRTDSGRFNKNLQTSSGKLDAPIILINYQQDHERRETSACFALVNFYKPMQQII